MLLLDEPLASVDDQSREALRDLLINTEHRTVVWVTHDPNDAKFATTTITLTSNNARSPTLRSTDLDRSCLQRGGPQGSATHAASTYGSTAGLWLESNRT